jgi:O-antigen/teichoic acid export membrane protein
MAIPIPTSNTHARELLWNAWGFVATTVFISSILVFFKVEIAHFYNDKDLQEYIWLVPVGVLSYGLLNIYSNIQVRKKQFALISTGKISQSLFNNALAACFGYWAWGVHGLIISWLISQYMNAFVLSFQSKLETDHSRSDSFLKFSWSRLKEYRDFPLINSLHAFTDIFATQFVLFWIITFFFGKWELGLFAVMHRYVRAPITLITGSSSQLFFGEAADLKNRQSKIQPLFQKTILTSLLFSSIFVTTIIFFGPILFKWYLGPNWEKAGEYAQIMSPALGVLFFTSPLSTIPILFNQQKRAFLFSVLGYILSLSALLLAANYKFSFNSALLFYSIGFVVYYLCILLWYIYLIRKHDASCH